MSILFGVLFKVGKCEWDKVLFRHVGSQDLGWTLENADYRSINTREAEPILVNSNHFGGILWVNISHPCRNMLMVSLISGAKTLNIYWRHHRCCQYPINFVWKFPEAPNYTLLT